EQISNYTDVDISFIYDYYQNEFDFANWDTASLYDVTFTMMNGLVKISDEELGSPSVQEFIKNSSNTSYDLVFIEALIFYSFHGLIHHVGSPPVIGIMSFECTLTASYSSGIPDNPSYHPDSMLHFSDHMTFYERIESTMFWLFLRYTDMVTVYPKQEAVMRKYFGSAPPPLHEAERNYSLIMIARSSIFNYPLPLPPNVISFHSLHVKTTPDPLPKDLQKFLDEATDGVIYFSFGSNVLGKNIPEQKRHVFIEAFSELPQKILWKWELDILPGKPRNVKIGKWLPQQDVLVLSRDEPETSLERLIWWTEYVLRHKGAKHLRSAALDLHWYQYLLLDVAATCFMLMCIFTLLLYGNYGARILGIFPTPNYSHQSTFQTLMKALAARGHQITVISPNPLQVRMDLCVTVYLIRPM
ncbi:hypothetical protein L9F63_021222, partial [Diploptera punctata]